MPQRDAISDPPAAEAERLRSEIDRHNRLYHALDAPEISDAAFDDLFRRLLDLEAAHPELRTPDSPTQRVGADPLDTLPSMEHAAPMLSLDSALDIGAVRRFDDRLRRTLGEDAEPTYVLEPKLDGASLELVYVNGVLDRAVTRGNGRVGEGVTENVRTIATVPLRLRAGPDAPPAPPFLAVRGEAFMRLPDFEALNQQRIEADKSPYQNPRNATSGALRQLDSRIAASRPLEVVAYDIMAIADADPAPGADPAPDAAPAPAAAPPFARDSEALEALKAWGLQVPPRVQTAATVEEIAAYHARFAADRDALDYEIDGIVVKLDPLAPRESLGSTAHHPRWAVAFKFEPRKEVTRIDRIFVSVGRTGVLTPVALLRPVEVGGVTVSRASLHNREELERKDVRAGDRVRVQRAGDVIPQIVEVVKGDESDQSERGPPFSMPKECPSCGAEPIDRGPFTACPNRLACPAQLQARISHFGSRSALDIEGLGAKTAELLVREGLVTDLADLFDLRERHLTPLEGFAEVSARNLVAAIDARRSTELARLLVGLGIPEVGVTVARDLAIRFRSLDALRAAPPEDLDAMPGIGPKMTAAIRGFFDEPRVSDALDRLLAKGFDLSVPDAPPEPERGGTSSWAGRTVAITGKLEAFTRDELAELLRERGARVVTSLSGSTDLLVVGAKPGSKRDKAERLGVETATEPELRERLGAEIATEQEPRLGAAPAAQPDLLDRSGAAPAAQPDLLDRSGAT